MVGPSARRVIPLSALVGATLLTAADVVARLVGDVPVGVVMALLGAPFFLFLLHRIAIGVRAVTARPDPVGVRASRSTIGTRLDPA